MLKIEFSLEPSEVKALEEICTLIVFVCVPNWFQATSSTKATHNDLTLLKQLVFYEKIDPTITTAVIKIFSTHLWYLSSETIGFKLFDDRVPDNINIKMVSALGNDTDNERKKFDCNINEPKRLIANNVDPSHFVNFQTKSFFPSFGLKLHFSNCCRQNGQKMMTTYFPKILLGK